MTTHPPGLVTLWVTFFFLVFILILKKIKILLEEKQKKWSHTIYTKQVITFPSNLSANPNKVAYLPSEATTFPSNQSANPNKMAYLLVV